MNSDSRRFPRTDRPGSGVYRGEEVSGLAFDDYRSADEQKAHHQQEKRGFWRGLLGILRGPAREEDLLEKARAALAHDPTLETDHIHLSVERAELRVGGSVTSRWMKEQVTDCLLKVPGIKSIQNELLVRPRHNRLPQEGPLAI